MQTRITFLAAAVYVPLTLAAFAWAWLADSRLPWAFSPHVLEAPYPTRLGVSVALGLGLAWGVIGLTRALVGQVQWAADLNAEFREMLTGLRPRDVLLLSLASGIGEEFFFRGALQPVVGLLVASLIFGGVHVGPRRVFLPWTVWAFVMGLLLGGIFELTGVLWGPILAHVLINQRNMTFILQS